MSADVEKSFHDLRLNPNEEMYIQLNFPNNTVVEYLSALEDNPHEPNYIKAHKEEINEKDAALAEKLITHVMKLSETEKRNRLIDEALDTGNKAWFMELTSQFSVEGALT